VECESLLADFPSKQGEEVDLWSHHCVCMFCFNCELVDRFLWN
jgi:hypothetical protein